MVDNRGRAERPGAAKSGLFTANFHDEVNCMYRYVFITSCLLLLGGCYTVNNERFAADIHKLLEPGFDMASATRNLEAIGFSCDSVSAAPWTTCTKTRQGILPYTCIERVNLMPASKQTGVERVDMPQIMCAGL